MSNVEATSTVIPNLDVRPILPVSDETVLDKAVGLRDRFAIAIAAVLEQENVQATLVKSQPGNYPAWIRLEAWIPVRAEQPLRHERCELELIIEARPFNRHSLTCAARLRRGKQTIAVSERHRFSEADVLEWARYAIGRGPKPSNYGPVASALREQLAVFIPPLSPRYNPIDRQFRAARLDARMLVAAAFCGLLVVALIFREWLTPITLTLASVAFVTAILLPVFGRRYRYHDWVIPQPREGPRHLGHVDSWHAIVVRLGNEAERLKQWIVADLDAAAASMLDIRSERYGYHTPNGYEERERLVISHRQGHVHVHLDPLGDDLFVGWQAQLNWAQWAETSPITTVEAGRHQIAFRDVKPSWYYPNEFDLIDLNSLSAVVHSAVEREVKRLLSECSSDQEIDFEVIRSDRGNALDARKAWPERSSKRERKSNLILGSGGVQRTSAGEMQLTPVDAQPQGRPRGIAAIPAVILLPVLTVLAYFSLYQSGAVQLYQFQQQVAPNFSFGFFPMFHLPLAVVLAIGLVLYARINVIQALLVVAVIEASTFAVGHTYYILLSRLIVPRDLAFLPIGLSFTAGAIAASGLCYLMAAAIWVPSLREGRRWLVAIVLWAIWAAATSWAIREFRIVGPAGLSLVWGLRVVMAACFGFWLREEQPGTAALRQRRAQPAVSSRSTEVPRPQKERRSILLPIAAVAVLLGLLEVVARSGLVSRFVLAPPSLVLQYLPLLIERNAASLVLRTVQDVILTSILVTAAATAVGLLLQRYQSLRAAVLSWIAATARAPVLLLYPASVVIFGLVSTIKIIAFVAGLAPAILKTLEQRPGSSQNGDETLLRSAFATWLLSLTLAFAAVVSLESLMGSGGLGALVSVALARADIIGLYSGILLVVLISAVLAVIAGKTEALENSYVLSTPAIEGSRRSAVTPKIVIVFGILVGWEAVARSSALPRGLLPPLATLTEALINLLTTSQFYSNLYVTCYRIAFGMLIGGLGAFVVGLMLRRSKPMHQAFEPILYYLDATPKIIFYPVMILIFGISGGAVMALAALACFFPVALHFAAAGTDQPEGFRGPLIRGLQPGLRAAILSTLLAEGFAANQGLGHLTIAVFQNFRMPQGIALLIVTLALAIAADALMGKLFRARAGGH